MREALWTLLAYLCAGLVVLFPCYLLLEYLTRSLSGVTG